MKSRNELISALGKINTKLAVQAALDHALDLLRLNPQDNMYVRSCVPTLFLRLGRDQGCYSFCKWWVTVGHDYDYDWRDTRPSQLIMKNTDAFEPVDAFERVRNFTRPNPNNKNVPSFSDLSHVVAVTLVKIRILLTLNGTSPTYMSPIVTGNLVIMSAQNQKANIEKLDRQIKKLYDSVKRINKHFWPALLKPYYHFTVTPYEYGMGDEGEMQSKLRECYNAWIKTPGAIELIRKLTEG
ncbi:Zinc finger domain-containing protein MYND-type [Pyrenophora tritici-repentis]|nr:Zinc finger MYND-type [Pyrenophora tritici-repentis]KAG9385056.1 Zinc finger MYND-type [Pyrenophora tritici-repentis]KAI1528897.1 Zinc finger domain-containing protein MYND-type [Pyrenophora tritici-repentis]KAI1541174.1 Zinc finger domain-containing protein MYND-type [Pyrenophora tritici-repentis]KAI1554101.1 Zinc finger domain-containing protein MYND-type [Pyrenophora tritici-repentis]